MGGCQFGGLTAVGFLYVGGMKRQVNRRRRQEMHNSSIRINCFAQHEMLNLTLKKRLLTDFCYSVIFLHFLLPQTRST